MEIAVGSKPSASRRGSIDAHVAEVIGPGVVLLAVAEGFGMIRGQATPAFAAASVRDALRRRFRTERRDPRSALIAALSTANARVFAHSGSHDDYIASGTSISVALIVGDRAHIAHVGRTRAYLCRDGSLMALTSDDELIGEGWNSGRATLPTGAMTGHLLTRTLGTQPTLDASVSNMRLMHGDALVLATVGIHETIGEEQIAGAIRAGDSSESVTQRLLEAVRARAADVSGTVIVGRALTDPVEPAGGGRSFSTRTAALVLAVLFLASLLAAAVAHAFISP